MFCFYIYILYILTALAVNKLILFASVLVVNWGKVITKALKWSLEFIVTLQRTPVQKAVVWCHNYMMCHKRGV